MPADRLRPHRDGQVREAAPRDRIAIATPNIKTIFSRSADAIDLGDRVLLVLDDWGAVLGFDWAGQNSHRVQGIVHMEAVAAPLNWSDLSEEARSLFRALRSKSRPSERRCTVRYGIPASLAIKLNDLSCSKQG